MYQKYVQENDLFLIFPENREPITRKWSITGPRSITDQWFPYAITIGSLGSQFFGYHAFVFTHVKSSLYAPLF